MSKGLLKPDNSLILPKTFGISDHFTNKNTTLWTTTATDLGAAAMLDAAGGVIQLQPSDGTVADNDEVYLFSTNEIFKFAAGKPISICCLVQFAQAATNAANVFFGLMDAWAANAIQDNGAGPKSSFSGCGFYAYDGSVNWNVITSDGATQTKAELTATQSLTKEAKVAASSAYQLLCVEVVPRSSTLMDVIFKINGSTVFKMMDRTFANATEMAIGIGAKNGSANQQVVNVDAIDGYQAV